MQRRSIVLLALLVAIAANAIIYLSANDAISPQKKEVEVAQSLQITRNPSFTLSPGPNPERGFSYKTYIKEIDLPHAASGPLAIYVDSMNRVWFTENNVSRLAVLTPINGTIEEYPVPHLQDTAMDVWDLIADDQGNIWFPETKLNALVKFDPKTNQFFFFQIPTESAYPFRLKLNDGKIWFTELRAGKIGWIDTRDYRIKEYEAGVIRSSNIPELSGPAGIDIDNKGHVWFAKSYSFLITELDPKSAKLKDYSLPETFYSPTGLTFDAGRDGLWITEHGGSRIAFFSPANDSLTAIHTSPTFAYPISLPLWTILDDKGRIWFNEHTGNTVGFLDINEGYMVEYHLPSNYFYYPLDIALDHRGQLWFTEYTRNRIAVLSTSEPLPFTFSVDTDTIRVQKGETVSLGITIWKTKANETLNLSIDGQLSSRWPLKIKPENLTMESLDSMGYFNVQLEFPKDIESGRDHLTLSVSDGTVTYSRIIMVEIS